MSIVSRDAHYILTEWADVSLDGKASHFQVNCAGRVYNTRRNRDITPYIEDGRLMVSLYFRRGVYRTNVARLVAEAFVSKPDFPPVDDDVPWADATHVMHLDGNRENCHYNNLVWRPLSICRQYMKELSKPPTENELEVLTRVVGSDETYSIRDAAMFYGCPIYLIRRSMAYHRVVYPGYVFELAN